MVRIGDDIGGYRVVDTVDRGELSTVYRVEHAHLGTSHALKLLHDVSDPLVVRSVIQGARLQACVDHTHVVRCTDGGLFRGTHPYMVMDWMGGGSLATWLDRHGALPIPAAIALFRGLCRGVHALHALRIVHRDLKPQNVLLQEHPDGRRRVPKLTDLGLAKQLVEGAAPVASGISTEFRTLGTPEYMAPEQASAAGEVDRRADLWSLGIVLYEILTNEVPFEADESWRTLVAARIGKYVPLKERRPDAPDDLCALVAELLRPEPDQRVQSCTDLLSRLDRVVARAE